MIFQTLSKRHSLVMHLYPQERGVFNHLHSSSIDADGDVQWLIPSEVHHRLIVFFAPCYCSCASL